MHEVLLSMVIAKAYRENKINLCCVMLTEWANQTVSISADGCCPSSNFAQLWPLATSLSINHTGGRNLTSPLVYSRSRNRLCVLYKN